MMRCYRIVSPKNVGNFVQRLWVDAGVGEIMDRTSQVLLLVEELIENPTVGTVRIAHFYHGDRSTTDGDPGQ
jgi:hypothetical protein